MATCSPCREGRDSLTGSAECDKCAAGYYRPSADSSASECRSCGAIWGVSCGFDATIAAVNLTVGAWRHSNLTLETWTCKSMGGWTPCRGGVNAGHEGNGYCADGHVGPRCELCDGEEHTRYFDKLDARCHDCGDVTAVIGCSTFLVLLMTYGGSTITRRLTTTTSSVCRIVLRWLGVVKAAWETAGMRYKLKTFIGYYQCIAAVPSVFKMVPPLGLEAFTRWINLVELPSEMESVVVASACLGDYRTRVWLGSVWPIAVIFVFAVGFILWECLLCCLNRNGVPPTPLAVLRGGLQRVLPLTLGLTFLLVPGTSTRIFKSFLCETFEYGDGEVRRYLYADLALRCDSEEHEATRATALLMLAVWPVGIPLLYAGLLWLSRRAIRNRVPTPLSRATAFLWGDYRATAFTFWWEPLEMCRKLTMTGWVLMIEEDAEHARVLVALLVSIVFLALELVVDPLKRWVWVGARTETRRASAAAFNPYPPPLPPFRMDNRILMTLVHLSLVLVYTCVLLVKACDASAEACALFGFGTTSKGASNIHSMPSKCYSEA